MNLEKKVLYDIVHQKYNLVIMSICWDFENG